MLYGHVETHEERVEHLCRIRALQDETGHFMCFIPLAFHPENTELHALPGPTGFDDLMTVAVSRLMLDNFDHVKAYWIMLTARVAQTALNMGADCFDGTVVDERSCTWREPRHRGLHGPAARDAGGSVQRDSLCNVLQRVTHPRSA
jgi:aminodeoxyfutalosine synthase